MASRKNSIPGRQDVPLHRGVQLSVGAEPPKATRPVPDLFVPIADSIAGWFDPPPEQSSGGVVLPTGAQHKYQTMILNVVAVGPKCEQIKAGDRVLVGNSAPGQQVIVGEHVFVVTAEAYVAGVLRADPVPRMDETHA